MGRLRVLVVVFALVSGLFWSIAAVGANGAPDLEDAAVARVAEARSSSALASYAVADDLVAVARRHAARMASEGRLYHNPSLGSEVSGWDAVGENVGTGPSVDDIHRAFMASDTHRHAILSSQYTQIGVGVEVGPDGALWVVQVFRLPAPAPASAAPPREDRGASVRAASSRRGVVPTPPTTSEVTARPVTSAAPVAVAVTTTVPAPPPVDPEAPVVVAGVGAAFGATGFAAAPAVPPVRVVPAPSVHLPSPRDVTAPIGGAATLLLLAVVLLLSEVRRSAYAVPVSVWRRQRNQASMSSSRSPSSTAWTLPVS